MLCIESKKSISSLDLRTLILNNTQQVEYMTCSRKYIQELKDFMKLLLSGQITSWV